MCKQCCVEDCTTRDKNDPAFAWRMFLFLQNGTHQKIIVGKFFFLSTIGPPSTYYVKTVDGVNNPPTFPWLPTLL